MPRDTTARIDRVTIEANALTSAPLTAHFTPVRPRPRSASRSTCPSATVNVIGTARANTLPDQVNMNPASRSGEVKVNARLSTMASNQPDALPSCCATQTATSSRRSCTHPLAAALAASTGALTASLTTDAADLIFSLVVEAIDEPLSFNHEPALLATVLAPFQSCLPLSLAHFAPSVMMLSAGTAAGAPTDTASPTLWGAAEACGTTRPTPISTTRTTPARRAARRRIEALIICSRPRSHRPARSSPGRRPGRSARAATTTSQSSA